MKKEVICLVLGMLLVSLVSVSAEEWVSSGIISFGEAPEIEEECGNILIGKFSLELSYLYIAIIAAILIGIILYFNKKKTKKKISRKKKKTKNLNRRYFLV
jgi:NADH:ubiquinone oxidoreductase subunit 5 (subunit L)/multisubunit Na+/H+ antiporter MnhA subunit